jgi:hypothetical protein
MTARMAGYGDKLEHEVSGQLDVYTRLHKMSDGELAAYALTHIAPDTLELVIKALPPALAAQLRALPEDAKHKVLRSIAGYPAPS